MFSCTVVYIFARMVPCALSVSTAFLVIVSGFCLATPAAFAASETLMGALKDAYKTNPSLLAERARQRASDEAVPQALSGFRPTVSLNGGIGHNRVRTKSPIEYTDTKPSNVGISVSQPLFQGFRTINSTRRAKAEVFAGQETLFEKEQATLLSVVTVYMDVRRARRISRLRRDNVDFLKRELAVVSARAKAGELTRTDTDQAKSRLYLGRATLEEAKAEVSSAEARYEAIVGHRPKRLRPAPPVRHLLPPQLSEAINAGEADNPLILAAEYRKEAAEHDVHVLRGDLLPTVSLDGRYDRSFNSSTDYDRKDEASVEVRFSMPLYNAGTTFSKIRQARAVARQREHEVADVRREVKASVIAAWQRRLAAHRRMRASHSSVSSAEAALKGLQLEAAVGERTVFDVLDAQRDVVDARVQLVTAERDFIVSTFTLISAIGKLSAEKLELDTAYYDPDRNYRSVRYSPGWVATVSK